MNLLLFAGAGTSVELGVPAMRRMAEQLYDHMRNQRLSDESLAQIQRLLQDTDNDMEHLIDITDNIAKGLSDQKILGMEIDEERLERFTIIRQEAEWFIQHACERVQYRSAERLWGPLVRHLGEHKVVIATTNYDRAIEMACESNNVRFNDGFEEFGADEFAKWRGIEGATGNKLLKLHGSTDWYQANDGSICKLRHPMPLYGGLVLTSHSNTDFRLTSAIVLPSREKKTTEPPYPELTTEFRLTYRQADAAIFVGTSLRDADIRDVCVKCSSRIPTFLVSRSGNYADGFVPNGAKIIRQTGSQFLISTLPKVLRNSDLSELNEFADSDEFKATSILDWLVTACDPSRDVEDRCRAIEELATARVSLDSGDIEPLLEDSNESVRIYSLGLVQDSRDRDSIVNRVMEIAREESETAFSVEARLLEDLLAQEE